MPQPFRIHAGIVAPLDRQNVDTDQIVPKQFLKRIERAGFGKFLFYEWAHTPDGQEDCSFILNQPPYRSATILATGKNFGCGSSREHAPWALLNYGFRAIIAPSFADIFATNCFLNGLLTVVLLESQVMTIIQRAQQLEGYPLTVDLLNCTVGDDMGLSAKFEIDGFRRECLLHGLDEIARTLRKEEQISAYETRHAERLSRA